MVSRFFIICPGCLQVVMVRLSVGSLGETHFYAPCPYCGLPVRGQMSGSDLETLRVEFEAEQTSEADGARSVMVDPDIPCLPSTTSVGEMGGGPNANLLFLTGENVERLMLIVGAARAIASEHWKDVARHFEYYLEEQWDYFIATGTKVFGEAWPVPTTAHERHSRAHDALLMAFGPLQVDSLYREFIGVHNDLFLRALRQDDYRAFLREEERVGSPGRDMRRLFDVADLLFRHAGSWLPGIIWWLVPEERIEATADYRIFRDDFAITRDLYQQGFEACCKSLRYAVATRNAAERGDINDFGDRPSDVTWRWPPSLSEYDKLANAWKIRVLGETPPWAEWADVVLDRPLRNAIGHNSTRHDLRTGELVNDEGDAIPYFDFLGGVYRMTTGLLTMSHVLRSIRIGSSNDF